jgi:hypothetical protein
MYNLDQIIDNKNKYNEIVMKYLEISSESCIEYDIFFHFKAAIVFLNLYHYLKFYINLNELADGLGN